jgi:hypothetical protein
MRPVLIILVLLVGVVYGAARYKEYSAKARLESVRHNVVSQPAAAPLSLEERAAKAQGTTLPPKVPRSNPLTADRPVERADSAVATGQFQCDGRSYCSQMHSCEEAKWFLKHCPGMNMDGEGDGIPCERQWCKHP